MVRPEHENSYRRTISSFARSVDADKLTPAAVPRVLNGLRAELAQCIELLLISPEFYSEQMEILQHVENRLD